MKSSTKPATTFMEGTYFDEGKEYPFSLNSAEIYYIFNAICSYDLDDDNEIYQILEIIASEIDDFEPHYIIDDKELSIYLGD